MDDAELLTGLSDNTLVALYQYALDTHDQAAADAIALEVGVRSVYGRWSPGRPVSPGTAQGAHRPPRPGAGGANQGSTEHERSDLTGGQ